QQNRPSTVGTITDTKQRRDDPRMARTRARALEATLELAAESGLHACTFDAVSERSGVARSTLYRHWSNQSELVTDALASQDFHDGEHVAPDTGSLRDDMLIHMLGLGRQFESSTWGAMVPQLVAAASTDPDMSDILRKGSDYYLSIDADIIERARERGEVASDIDSTHAALLFSAPIFYRYFMARHPVDGRWITSHVDAVVGLLRSH
ncbi:MAG: TetR/AcrR family transcriptional regulator, partial [Chloroflexi bacterium]|nr:TetR/AcrR family transcriptional regulator [Chloroflexota bacterium]